MARRRAMRMRVCAGATVAALAAGAGGLSGAAAASAAPAASSAGARVGSDAAPTADPASRFPAPRLAWKACAEAKGTLCATALVPLDYAKPAGPRLALAVAERPARDAKRRIGTLFVNPGGPGTPATGALDRFAEVLGRAVTDRFDLVAVDPRGVGGSGVLRCWSRSQGPAAESDGSYPITAAQQRQRSANDAFERGMCARTGRPILDHMTTADTARDMDVIRRSVGDTALNYYGVSYGTYLGATYGALFPTTVRTMLLDGVVDPVAWSTGYGTTGTRVPVSARVGAGASADEALRAAFAACRAAGPTKCPHGATVASEWNQVVARLRKGPVTTRDGDVVTLDGQMGSILPSLYDRTQYPQIMGWIHDAYRSIVVRAKTGRAAPKARSLPPALALPGAPARGLTPVAPTTPMPRDVVRWDTFQQAGVMCSDAINPAAQVAWGRYVAWPGVARSWFGPSWAWQSSICAGWPAKPSGVYRGPFGRRTSRPYLVVGNLHDPSTPYANAQRLAATSPGARLLTVDGWGHTSADQGACAAKVRASYLLTGALPAAGTVCRAPALFG